MTPIEKYVSQIPFTADWTTEARAMLATGLVQLQAIQLRGPVEMWVGMLSIDDEGQLDTRVVLRVDGIAASMEGHDESGRGEHISRALEQAHPGHFMIWIMTPWYEAVIGVPALRDFSSRPGQNN